MRLANLRNSDVANGQLFKLTEGLATSIISFITAETNKDELTWAFHGANVFSAKFDGLELSFEHPNDEPPLLHIAGIVLQDNGSDSYGFRELNIAIYDQKKRLAQRRTIVARSRSRDLTFYGSGCGPGCRE